MGIGFGRILIVPVLLLGMTAGAHAGAQEDLERIFQEGARLLRQNRSEEALEKFKDVIRQDPGHEAAFRIWSQTHQSIWNRMLDQGGEFKQVAVALIEKATVERKRRMSDPETIAPLVKEALHRLPATRRTATTKLKTDHGEFAAPHLIRALGDPDDEDGQIFAQQALVTMGPQVTLPLLAALESDNAVLRRNLVITLRRLRDQRALGSLKFLAENDEDSLVRGLARGVVADLGGPTQTTESLLLALAADYRTKNFENFGRFEQGDTVWEWEEGRLVSRQVPELVYPFEISRQVALRALAANPTYRAAKAEIVLSFFAERASIDQRIDSGDADEKLIARGNQLLAADVVIAASGLDVVRQAARAAMALGDAQICQVAFQALALLESSDTLTSSPLMAALQHESSQVQDEAAKVIARITPEGRTQVPVDVAARLSELANKRLTRLVQTIGLKDNARNVAEAAGRKSEIAVAQASSGGEGLNRALSTPADLFLIHHQLPDLLAIQVVNELRRNPSTRDKKIVIVASNLDLARKDLPEDKVDLFLAEDEIAGDFGAKIFEILAGFEVDVARARALQDAREAAASLAKMDTSQIRVPAIEANLIHAVDHEDDDVVKGVLQALAGAGTSASIAPILGVVASDRPLEVRKAGANALGRILARGGSLSIEQAEVLYRIATGSEELELRTAVAGAFGRATVDPSLRLQFLRTFRLPDLEEDAY